MSQRGHRREEEGQALVLFVLALAAIVGMAGLVLDGGAAFAQRRQQQNVADLAAEAGAIAYANTPGNQGARTAAARARALAVAALNGYADGVDSTDVKVQIQHNGQNSSTTITVEVDRPHTNAFAGVVGQPTWDISTEATAITGIPNGAIGSMPLIFNQEAFSVAENFGEPGNVFQSLQTGNETVPQDGTSFNWTVFCTGGGTESCNADTETVGTLIDQKGEDTLVQVGDNIQPMNAGAHTELYGRMEKWVGEEFPVAIVDDEGHLIGWAIFHLTDVGGTAEKTLSGYFVSPVNHESLQIVGCRGGAGGNCSGGSFGSYTIKLID